MIFDTHAHYDDRAFLEDGDALLTSLSDCGIGAVTDAASTYQSLGRVRALTEQYAHVYGAYGIHPSDIGTVPRVVKQTDDAGDAAEPPALLLDELRALCRHEKAVAVGEIGLDYHWDKDNKRQQQAWFRAQINLARELGLPVVIHSREAADDTLRIVRQEKLGEIGGVMHCYSYSVELAREYLNMGLYLGIGGVLTFKNARKLREVVSFAPVEQLVTETDCPYLAPTPHRGERNDSRYLPLVIKAVAEIKGIDAETVEQVTWENAQRLYRLI